MNAKKLLSAACAAVALWVAPAAHAQVVPAEQAPELVQAQDCRLGYLIAVPGGANTAEGIPDSVPHGGNVFSTGLLVQAQSAGQIQPLWVSYHSTPFFAERYPAAAADGYNRARQAVADLAARCPQSRFSFTGYSLGADVVSRITNDIAYGRGPISPDKVSAVALFANPYQGGNGAVPASVTNPASRGALGSLPGGFGDLGGRVLEICFAEDLVCSMPEQFRGLVGPAMATNLLGGEVPAALNTMLSSLGINVGGLVSGLDAHGRYNFANRKEAADWIVSHT